MYLIGYDFASKKIFFLNNYDFIVRVVVVPVSGNIDRKNNLSLQ
jgi:hypothetical protein